MKKAIIKSVSFMDHKAFIPQLAVLEINSSVVDDSYRLPLTLPAGPYFLPSRSKQKTGIISAQLHEVR